MTTRISVQQLLMSPVNKKQLLGVLTGIAAAVSDAEEYMIDVRSILFDQNYIFVDAAGETTVMICLPVAGEQKQLPDMKLFFKELLFTVSLNPGENNDYFVRMINYLNKEASFSTEAFSDFLKKLSVESALVVQGSVQAPARQEMCSRRHHRYRHSRRHRRDRHCHGKISSKLLRKILIDLSHRYRSPGSR